MDVTNRAIQDWCVCWARVAFVIQELWENAAFQMLLGAIASGLIAVLMDWLRRPKLKIAVKEPTLTSSTEDANRKVLERYKAVRVLVTNTKRWPKWWPRQTLLRATAQITFHNAQTGADLFDRKMRGRWASLPQPEIVLLVDRERRLWPDPSLIASVPEIDIPWGEVEPLDIASRFENDADAFGWSNDSYYDQQEKYRAQRWILRCDQCLVKVVVQGSGEKCCEVFRLRKPTEWDLRLVSATHAEKRLLN